VHCRRPRIISGGELTIEMLDLQYNPLTKFYTAPLQVKANNGVLIVDDFGRQRVLPEVLLNRWIVPLDRKIDFLTLAGGKKFEIPFDLFVVFSTNLNPSSLADDAFMRRIQNKIKIDNVSREQFQEIFARVCRAQAVDYHPAVVEHLMDVITEDLKEPLRPCYPRDVVMQILWSARYEGKNPQLSRETVERACRNYFLSTQTN
jgi:predicted ATPase with chaperone activity